MKKLKKNENKFSKSLVRKPDLKCSRITVDSKVCNKDKFDELFQIIDNTTIYKNKISLYCFKNLNSIVTDYSAFLPQYKKFTIDHLNSWESQTIFQEICGHYYETATRYLHKAQFVVTKNNKNNIAKTNITNIAKIINSNSFLTVDNNGIYILDFNIFNKLKQLNNYLEKHNADLLSLTDNELIIKLKKTIASYHKLIVQYKEIESFSINKPEIYNRLITLITNKKLRLLSQVKLGVYQTGTHARNLNNAQMSIVEDLTNNKYQYFLKVRKLSTLIGREPKDKDLDKDNI